MTSHPSDFRLVSNMSNSHDGEPCNIDPSVAALLLDLPSTASSNDVKVRMGLIRLSQARIHGNATYAATILQHAFAESKQSQQVHGLLGEKLSVLERLLVNMPIDDGHDDIVSKEKRQISGTGDAEPKLDAATTAADDTPTAAAVPVRVVPEESLAQSLLCQISSIQEDRKLLRKQENRLRDRLKGLETLIEETAPGNTELRQAFAASREYVVPSSGIDCVVCRARPAERAIIPCGHLCLCDGCTQTLVASSSTLQYCPLCRGSLQSTLRVYIPK